MLRTTWLSLVVVGAAITASHAQTASTEAEKLFRDGRALMSAQQFAEACDAFEASQKLDPHVNTLANLAACREKNQQFATAWGLFIEVERQTRGEDDKKALRDTAIRRAAGLEPRLSYLIINVPDENRVEGLVITRNGEVVDPVTWNRSLPVDGGTYTIEGKAPAHEAWSTTVAVENEGDKASVDVPKFKELPELQQPADENSPVVHYQHGGLSSRRKIALGVGVGGIIGLGAAGTFEVLGRGYYSDAKSEPRNDVQAELTDKANRSRRIAIVAGSVGVAATAFALYLWFSDSSERASESHVEVVPAVSEEAFGAVVVGSF
jgi:hypothetical protein